MATLKNISFHPYPGRIRLSINLLEELDYPKYVRFMINTTSKEVAVQVSSKEDSQALKVFYNNKITQGAMLHSTLVLRKIFEEMKWDTNFVYRTTEYRMSGSNIIIVKLDTAKQVKRYS